MQQHTLIRDHQGQVIPAGRTRRVLSAYDALTGTPAAPWQTTGDASAAAGPTGLPELDIYVSSSGAEARLDYTAFTPIETGGVRELRLALEDFRLRSSSPSTQEWALGFEAEGGERVEAVQRTNESFAVVQALDAGGTPTQEIQTEWALGIDDDETRRAIFSISLKREWYGNDLGGQCTFVARESGSPRASVALTDTELPPGGARPYVRLLSSTTENRGFMLSTATLLAFHN